MSIVQKALRNDIDSYLRGEEPPPEELERAPRLDGWAPTVARGPDGKNCMTLSGCVTGHPMLPDGKSTETSVVVWLDRRGRFARSRNRLWRLGPPAAEEK